MQRIVLLVSSIGAALVLASGVALADHLANTVQCPTGGGYCYGTEQSDHMYGSDVLDNIYAYGGDDQVDANDGDDYIEAGKGNDTVYGGEG
jgi:hypothetical protein